MMKYTGNCFEYLNRQFEDGFKDSNKDNLKVVATKKFKELIFEVFNEKIRQAFLEEFAKDRQEIMVNRNTLKLIS